MVMSTGRAIWKLYSTKLLYVDNTFNFLHTFRKADVLTYIDDFPDYIPYLMIAHGGKDENVHFAHTANLIQELNSRRKPYEFKVCATYN